MCARRHLQKLRNQGWRSFVRLYLQVPQSGLKYRGFIARQLILSSIMPRPELSQEQASLLASQEYDHLQSSYSSLVKSLSLASNNQVSLTTLEGGSYTITVTSDGWKVVEGGQFSERERTWEMVEDLLRSVSPLFKQGWDLMLLEKLNSVADAQRASPQDDD